MSLFRLCDRRGRTLLIAEAANRWDAGAWAAGELPEYSHVASAAQDADA